MKNIKICMPIIIVALLIIGCSDSEMGNINGKREISASVTATLSIDGKITTSEPIDEQKNRLDGFFEKVRQIDSDYPGANMPSIDNLHRVKSIQNDFSIELEDGTLIQLAGCDCENPAALDLNDTFINNDYQLLYLKSGFKQNGRIYAYVWEVDLGTGEENTEGIPVGTTMGRVNEKMILNKWCKPIEQPFHKYFDRFLAYSKIKN